MPSHQRIDPRQIVVARDTRQRQENIADVEDLKQSISEVGIINALVVRRQGDDIVLVAGERRLKASLELGLEAVPINYFEDLSPEDAERIELEENVKRKELAWKDQVKAVGRIHALYTKTNPDWNIEQTAKAISLHHSHVRKILHVFTALEGGRITKADSIEQAYNTLHKFAERKAESIVGDLITKGAAIFGAPIAINNTPISEDNTFSIISSVAVAPDDLSLATMNVASPSAEETVATPPQSIPQPVTILPPRDPILCTNFGDWVASYTGPKFTLIHCDFPYGNYKGNDSQGSLGALDTEDFYDNTESVYWNLLDILTKNLDKIMSYQAHLVFWFNMNFYTETVTRLRRTGLMVHDHPLVWHKTGGPGGLGVAPGTDATHPRRTYDTALLAVRGNRPLVRSMCNSYAAPTAGNKIHPSQKPEPMLRYFLQMVVDETTTVFDPTCGSAAALRAAEDLGAKSILGIEMDANYARDANTKTLQARILRQAGSMRRDDVA